MSPSLYYNIYFLLILVPIFFLLIIIFLPISPKKKKKKIYGHKKISQHFHNKLSCLLIKI